MWSIQVKWADVWVTVQTGFECRDDAEWAIGKWKMANQCYGDECFRTYEQIEADEHDQRAEDEANYQQEIGRQLGVR